MKLGAENKPFIRNPKQYGITLMANAEVMQTTIRRVELPWPSSITRTATFLPHSVGIPLEYITPVVVIEQY